MSKVNFLNTAPCAEALDRIASKTFIRLSYEYGICMIRRDIIPALASLCLKSLIGNLNSLREGSDMSAHINLFDLVTFGVVELNFEETEKATNILPDFRIGPRGCKYCKMDYNEYSKHQVPIEEYGGRILNVKTDDYNETWMDLMYTITTICYANINLNINDKRLLSIFIEVFLEEVFYDLGLNFGKKDYAYKLFDILYFNYKDEDKMWGTDVMPEYKLIAKDDVYQEDRINSVIDEYEKDDMKKKDDDFKPLRYQ